MKRKHEKIIIFTYNVFHFALVGITCYYTHKQSLIDLLYRTKQISKKSICKHHYENNWYAQDKQLGLFCPCCSYQYFDYCKQDMESVCKNSSAYNKY